MTNNVVLYKRPNLSNYDEAKNALVHCERIDEVAEWKNKAAALEEYARQAKDKTLLRLAFKIKVRAMRRAGELAEEFRSQGGRPVETIHGTVENFGKAKTLVSAGFSTKEAEETIPALTAIPSDKLDEILEAEDCPVSVSKIIAFTKPKPAPKPTEPPFMEQHEYYVSEAEKSFNALRKSKNRVQANTNARNVISALQLLIGDLER